MRIERLKDDHDRSRFDCGKPQLNSYLQRYASQHDRKGFGRTYVLTDDPDDLEVIGFYTLASSSVAFENIPEELQRKIPQHPVPVVLLARMGVNLTHQKRGIGSLLLADALRRALKVADEIGVYAVEILAKNEQAKAFYLQFGFKELKDDPMHVYLPMGTIRKLYPPNDEWPDALPGL